MGGENLSEVVFNDVELPLENLVLRDNGMKRLLSAFNTQRCLNPAICLGLAEGALEAAIESALRAPAGPAATPAPATGSPQVTSALNENAPCDGSLKIQVFGAVASPAGRRPSASSPE